MSNSQPFRVLIKRRDGETSSYTLRSKVIKLSGGKEQEIRFFAHDEDKPPSASSQLRVIEHPRSSLPLDWQVTVARALVNLQGHTPDDAAEITGRLKANVERLTQRQTDAVIKHIRAALDEE